MAKFVSYCRGDARHFGLVKDGGIVRLDGSGGPADLRSAIAAGTLAHLAEAASARSPDDRLDAVTLDLPIPAPDKIVGVGRNYAEYHEIAAGNLPKWPSLFLRLPTSFTAHGGALVRPRASEQLDYEGELGVIIGKRGRHIREADALGHIAGYTCVNEGTIRDWLERGTQNTPAKNFHHCGSMGPWMVSADEIADPSALTIVTRVNGEERQRGRTDQMIAQIPFLIAHISTVTWLEPGDVISTGSPGGTGVSFKPPRWLKAGDTIEVEVEKVGTLTTRVEDE